ncbi:uncharacterized protein FFFS_15868 [Fusarium fujikuroi]|nr:uncharacterized protein FFFS_15868 [Fusarium fujikuroi]
MQNLPIGCKNKPK